MEAILRCHWLNRLESRWFSRAVVAVVPWVSRQRSVDIHVSLQAVPCSSQLAKQLKLLNFLMIFDSPGNLAYSSFERRLRL